jgi:hypothetical protein
MSIGQIFVFLGLTLLSTQAFAGPYSFGDGCASSGSWSKAALMQAGRIKGIIEDLMKDPNCAGIETIIPKIKLAEDALRTPEAEALRTDRIESIPNELSALRNFMIASPELKSQVMKVMGSRKLEAASLAVEKTVASGGAHGDIAKALGGALGLGAVDPASFAMAVALRNLEERSTRALNMGIDMLEQSLDVLPKLDRCLVHAPNQSLALLAATVKISAAFASSQDGVATKMSNVIAKLVTFLRNKRFMRALSELDESELWMSLSCLIETSAQTYCAARDAHKLLEFGIKELRPQVKPDGKVDIENPLAGYYILTRDVPKVSAWIQKIQFGIEPKLSSDAKFKNDVWREVTNLMITINALKGAYNEALLAYSTLPDEQSRRTSVLNLVSKISNGMGGSTDSDNSSGASIFFTQGILPKLIPYRLIGLMEIPADAMPRDNRLGMDFYDWALDGNKWQVMFHNPNDLIKKVGLNMDELVDQAVTRASLYFQQRMIVDVATLVNESVTSQAFTVVQSFHRIASYLVGLEKRILDSNDEESFILVPDIRDTRKRIEKVLQAYDIIKQTMKNPGDVDNSEIMKLAYQSVIQTVYDQFNILLQRDTFLPSKLSTFIHHDYAMRIRRNDDMARYEKDLMLEIGNDLLYRLMDSTGTNPTSVKNDIEGALVINKRNLTTIETLFKDNVKNIIGQLEYVINGAGRVKIPTFAKTYQVYKEIAVHQNNNPFANSWGYIWAFSSTIGDRVTYTPWARGYMHSEVYQYRPKNDAMRMTVDDEVGSFRQMKAKLCSQTLAFEDRKFFQSLCRGAVLTSAFDNRDGTGPKTAIPLNLNYDSYMTPQKRDKAVTADSICAFQTYNRRNLVYWLTLDLENR